MTKKTGAILYRNSVYVIPYSKDGLEDFNWLCQQIRDSKGEASVFVSEGADARENRSLISAFNATREAEYNRIHLAAQKVLRRVQLAAKEKRFSESFHRSVDRTLRDLEKTLIETEEVDFFSVPMRKKVRDSMNHIRQQLAGLTQTETETPRSIRYNRKEFRGRTWATREHIHIDRLCSAWLIRRFIDPKARFVFASEEQLPRQAILFDVFGEEFSHHGDDCTFETLMKAFRIKDKALSLLAQIVHDIDMKDAKFERPEAPGVDVIVRSLSDSINDDRKVLEIGSSILDALYQQLNRK